ncbi:MAG: hypothetical protein CO092_02260 [Candidatus Aenigmarchaeota archaeon CG_4_9_14_3_um_filter_37_18]|nr:MAG: hypothetical protein AUJ50_03255 [Candidatus Aenigmarchaeota archaeon CG1_02_38_14]PIV69021.1 MAG: hypothetical protein COS07_02195 [Candidatus Aenigmarchaeota archaeon CG01_land_8_20_14_3_00_37_9]PJB75311.1 MAG: hypothetical protein CO092_02260 [Candidatus Aenigmarchaeota archaeon CG_4_9_14_3_um_filter_37_18]
MPDLCVHCGMFATVFNKEDQPVCMRCREKNPKRYVCSKCKSLMTIRKGKYGSFWGCSGYPMCDNSVSIKQALMKERNKTNIK